MHWFRCRLQDLIIYGTTLSLTLRSRMRIFKCKDSLRVVPSLVKALCLTGVFLLLALFLSLIQPLLSSRLLGHTGSPDCCQPGTDCSTSTSAKISLSAAGLVEDRLLVSESLSDGQTDTALCSSTFTATEIFSRGVSALAAWKDGRHIFFCSVTCRKPPG